MGLSAPWADSIEIIDLNPVKMQGINPVRLSALWDEYIDIISVQTVSKIAGDEPNGP